MTELVCGLCAYIGYITWDGVGENRRPLDQSTYIKLHPSNPALFTCQKCGTEQPLK